MFTDFFTIMSNFVATNFYALFNIHVEKSATWLCKTEGGPRLPSARQAGYTKGPSASVHVVIRALWTRNGENRGLVRKVHHLQTHGLTDRQRAPNEVLDVLIFQVLFPLLCSANRLNYLNLIFLLQIFQALFPLLCSANHNPVFPFQIFEVFNTSNIWRRNTIQYYCFLLQIF